MNVEFRTALFIQYSMFVIHLLFIHSAKQLPNFYLKMGIKKRLYYDQ